VSSYAADPKAGGSGHELGNNECTGAHDCPVGEYPFWATKFASRSMGPLRRGCAGTEFVCAYFDHWVIIGSEMVSIERHLGLRRATIGATHMSSRKRPAIYLSGPLTGRSRLRAETWRGDVTRRLQPKYEVVDPAKHGYDPVVAYRKHHSAAQSGRLKDLGLRVVNRNKKLLRGCDVVLANFLGSGDRASIGAVGEVFLADALHKPILVVREAKGNVHDHAMLNAVATCVVYSLEDAYLRIPQLVSAKIRRVKRTSARAPSR
jgi:hypothetical protein